MMTTPHTDDDDEERATATRAGADERTDGRGRNTLSTHTRELRAQHSG